jgi:hypothetical protein
MFGRERSDVFDVTQTEAKMNAAIRRIEDEARAAAPASSAGLDGLRAALERLVRANRNYSPLFDSDDVGTADELADALDAADAALATSTEEPNRCLASKVQQSMFDGGATSTEEPRVLDAAWLGNAARLGDWMFNADVERRFAKRRDAREFAALVIVEAARMDQRGDDEAAQFEDDARIGSSRPCPACGGTLHDDETHFNLMAGIAGAYICPRGA